MFRRRPKAASESEAGASRRDERRDKKRRKAAPPGPLSEPEPRTDVGNEADGDGSSEPWYRQSGPLFAESFNDSPPAIPPQQPGGETAAAAFTPPRPADPAASGVPPSVPTIQRVGQVTDPGPLGEEMRSAFEPEAEADDDSTAEDDPADDDPADSLVEPETVAAPAPQEEPSPWAPPAAAPRSEPGIGSDDAAGDDDHLSITLDPLIDFSADAGAADESPDAGDAPEDTADEHQAEAGTDDDAGEDADDEAPGEMVAGDATPEDSADDEGMPDDDAAGEESTADASALPAESPPREVVQPEPPMVVPVRGYYIARTEDTLRSVAAQFLNAPERWSELRALNAAYPGVADLEPDELVPEGTALALPGDPLPWGRPDPVYLWTLAETFLFTAWGREPAPEEVVPFWRGLTQGALPEGEQSPARHRASRRRPDLCPQCRSSRRGTARSGGTASAACGVRDARSHRRRTGGH